jgi:hypothetical protein
MRMVCIQGKRINLDCLEGYDLVPQSCVRLFVAGREIRFNSSEFLSDEDLERIVLFLDELTKGTIIRFELKPRKNDGRLIRNSVFR